METPKDLRTTQSLKLAEGRAPSSMSPPSACPLLEQNSNEVHKTTVLAHNIHCGSCVKHVEDILCTLGSGILSVSVSVVNHEAQILHSSSVKPSDLCQILEDGAFEVVSATTVDKSDNVISEVSSGISFHKQAENWLHMPTRPKSSSSWLPFSSSKSKREQHLENCAACREEDQGQLQNDSSSSPGNRVQSADERSDSRGLQTATGDESAAETASEAVSGGTSSRLIAEPQKTSPLPTIDEYRRSENQATESFIMTMSIGGMTCASCSGDIRDSLNSIDGVQSVSVELMTNSATVQFQGSRELSKTIVERIEDMGKEVSEESIRRVSEDNNVKNEPPHQKGLRRATLSIGGMTCASCSNGITEGLKELPFIKSINITLMAHQGHVVYEDEENLEKIVEKVEDLGYDCTVEDSKPAEHEASTATSSDVTSRTIRLKVEGMFCEKCPGRIMDSLRSKFGAMLKVEAPLTLKNPIITIEYSINEASISIRSIMSYTQSLNKDYKVSVYHPPTIEERSQQLQLQERNRILLKLLVSAIVAIPTLLIGIVWMDLVPENDPNRRYFEEPMWAGEATRAQWALFFLASPVYFYSASFFHTRALKEIRSLWRRSSKVPILRRFYRFGSMNLLISAGTTVAYVASIAQLIISATSSGDAHATTYFDTVVFLTFFILIGRYLEVMSKARAGNAVSMLGKLRPQQAMLVTSNQQSLEQASFFVATSSAGLLKKALQPTQTQTIDADLLEIGDTVIVPHGSSPPADGLLQSSVGQFDESSLTGESRPIKKIAGEPVFVGTLNTGDPVKMSVTGLGGSSMLDQIITVVREGQTRRAPVERTVDIVTGYFVPVITALAIITFFVWLALGQSGALNPRYLDGNAGGWGFWSLQFAIAVFVVACPCGIGLAAPTALFVGGGLAANRGILVRGGGEAFQEASSLDAVVFDKTGTLTEGGALSVTDHEITDKDLSEDLLWAFVRGLEESSSHPIARALLELASKKPQHNVADFVINEVPGLGLRGTFTFSSDTSARDSKDTFEALLGSEQLLAQYAPELLKQNTFASQTLTKWKSEAKSVAVLGTRINSKPGPNSRNSVNSVESSSTATSTTLTPNQQGPWRLGALFATSDPIRPSAAPTVAKLQKRGIKVYMLSGDNPETARAVAAAVGIPVANVFAGVLPSQKAEKIRELQSGEARAAGTQTRRNSNSSRNGQEKNSANGLAATGTPSTGGSTTLVSAPAPPKAKAKIAFVGDGINDAPALLASTVSISLSTGSAIAHTSSSFILLGESLETIIELLDLSRRVFRRIRLNFAWALVYNVVLVPVAAGVFFAVKEGGFVLGPVWAAAAMAASSVSVVASSLLLRWEWGNMRVWLGGLLGGKEKREGGEGGA